MLGCRGAGLWCCPLSSAAAVASRHCPAMAQGVYLEFLLQCSETDSFGTNQWDTNGDIRRTKAELGEDALNLSDCLPLCYAA